MNADVLIRNGRVLDPSQGMDMHGDVAIRGGFIVAVGSDLGEIQARERLDVEGRLVCPGLIDLHTHVYPGYSELGLDPDAHCLPNGVTTVVDAGSAGASAFPAFYEQVVTTSRARVQAFLNLSTAGIVVDDGTEMHDPRNLDVDGCAGTIRRHREVLAGVKVRLGAVHVGKLGFAPVRLALEVAERADCKVMIHLTTMQLALEDVLACLRPGDIVTHALHGRGQMLVHDGVIRDAARRARDQGIVFDVGHGSGGFSYRTARAAIADGFEPDTISSDLHAISLPGPVKDLVTTASKFLALGMPLDRVIAAITARPAAVLGLQHEVGTLRDGSVADIAILDVANGPVSLTDSMGESIAAATRLAVWRTFRGGVEVMGTTLQ